MTFSRIATQRKTDQLIPLDEVVGTFLTDLDMLLSETGAVIHTGYLPTITGDARQLGQLFQNLLSNALKFRQPDA